MSLINEALKRAKQSQMRVPSAEAPEEPPLQPVIQAALAPERFAMVLPIAASGLVVIGCLFVFLWWRQPLQVVANEARNPAALVRSTKPLAQPPEPTVAAPSAQLDSGGISITQTGAPPTSSLSQSVPPAPALPLENASSVPDPEHVTNEISAPSPGPASQMAASALKLQGIFYRAAKASALIEGQTLFVGDEIDGAKVDLIDRYSVRLLKEGQTIVLKLR